MSHNPHHQSVLQALGKARGDGLGMEFSRAEFSVSQTSQGWRATVEIDGVKKPRYIHLHASIHDYTFEVLQLRNI